MQINTRYDPKQDVYCLLRDKGWTISQIRITSITWAGNSITYGGSKLGMMIPEEDCFPTYEEAEAERTKRNEGIE